MENASKALLIAGAILLAILIISLGLMAYNGAKNTAGSANLNKQEIEAFNAQWETYQGTNKTAAEVRALYSAVIANNAAEAKSGTNRKVKIGGSEPTSIPATLSNNSITYTIALSYDSTGTGLITNITYTANSATQTNTNP